MSPGNALFDKLLEQIKEEHYKEYGTSFDDDMRKYRESHPDPASIFVDNVINFFHWLTSLIIIKPEIIETE